MPLIRTVGLDGGWRPSEPLRKMHVGPFTGPAAAWDRFVRSVPGYTHFHLHGWKTVLERGFGHECLYLAAEQDDALVGVLPLVRVKSRLFGHFLVSMPFLNYGGPLGSDEAVRALVTHARAIAERDGAKSLELRSRFELPIEMPVSHRKVTMLLDLPDDVEGLWANFPAKLRSQARRATKEGVALRFGADQLAPFFAVFSRHMRDLGTPTQSRRLFETIADVFPDFELVCLRLAGRPAGRLRGRVHVGRRVRSHLGLLAERAQADRAEHAAICGPDGTLHRAGAARVQFRPLLARLRHAPLQVAMGCPRAGAVVVHRSGR